MNTPQCNEHEFLEDVKNHQLTIIVDDNNIRHIRMKRPDTNCYSYDITTWNGYLCISGDMGCYVFSRLSDMFEFFRMDNNDFNKNPNKKLNINLGYWAEKLQAVSKQGKCEEFSYDKFLDKVNQYVDSHVDDGSIWTKKQIKELKADIHDSISSDNTEQELYDIMSNYAYNKDGSDVDGYGSRAKVDFEVTDWFEYHGNCTEYTFHYIWCCYAIVYAIKAYDNLKLGEI